MSLIIIPAYQVGITPVLFRKPILIQIPIQFCKIIHSSKVLNDIEASNLFTH